MKLYGALAGVLALGWTVTATAGEPWEAFLDQVRIKQAIAETLTPEELEARRVRLAQWLYQQSLLGGGRAPGDTCVAATGETTLGPFNDTTVGAADNFDLPADVTAPTCTAASTCTGAGPAGSLPRGAIYTGTGTGPDRAFKIRSSTACTMTITMDPAAQDMALIAYQTTCSSSLADCACVDDTGVAGVAESVTLDMAAGTDYFVVADGYSTGGTPPGPADAYTMTFSGPGCTLVGDSTVLYTVNPSVFNFTGNVGVPTATQNAAVNATAGNTENLTLQSCTFGGANPGDFSFSPAPAFPLSVPANTSVNLPIRMTATAGGARSATLTCQVPNATPPSLTTFQLTLNGTATADVNPTLSYNPTANTPITFPTGAPGAATSSIAITSSGAVGAGSTSVTGCAFSGANPGAFTVSTTPANGVFNTGTTSGSINLGCTRGASASTATLTCTETPNGGAGVSQSWPVTCPVADAANVTATKTVAGTFVPGGAITYTITLTNTGTAATGDNAGDEFTDVLPGQLTLVSANATSGAALATIATRTVTWNGSLAAGASVTITINATINNTVGTVTNQGTATFDADGNGSNESTVSTDDPGVAGAANATVFAIGGSLLAIPALDNWSKLLAVLAVLGLGLGVWTLRSRTA